MALELSAAQAMYNDLENRAVVASDRGGEEKQLVYIVRSTGNGIVVDKTKENFIKIKPKEDKSDKVDFYEGVSMELVAAYMKKKGHQVVWQPEPHRLYDGLVMRLTDLSAIEDVYKLLNVSAEIWVGRDSMADKAQKDRDVWQGKVIDILMNHGEAPKDYSRLFARNGVPYLSEEDRDMMAGW